MSHKIPIITPHHLGFSSCVTKCKVHVGLFLYLLHSYRITVKYVNKDVIIGITFLSYKIGWRLWKVLFHQATSKRWISVISLLFFTYHRIWVGVKSSEAVKPGVKKHFLSKKLTTHPDVTLQNIPCRNKKGFLNSLTRLISKLAFFIQKLWTLSKRESINYFFVQNVLIIIT